MEPFAAAKPTLLVVDDTPENLMLMRSLLKDLNKLKLASDGTEALEIAFGEKAPDLILLDIMMPGIDGYEVCRRLKAEERTREIPVIFLTAKASVADEQLGLDLGAVDYITKPISPPIVLARVRNHLLQKAAADFLKDQNEYLEQEVRRRTNEIVELQDVTIKALASLAETRDNETGNHIRRTQLYLWELARQLQHDPRFADELTDKKIEILIRSAPLHDIGKVGVPDKILLKPEQLSPEEYEIMKRHAAIGRQAIELAEAQLGKKVDFLECAKEVAYSHHEKWDGTGYPEGSSGLQIPLSARMMALADVYDALVSWRIYKPGLSHEQARSIIVAGRGKHFDPAMVDAFIRAEDQFRQIARNYLDEVTAREQARQAPAD